MPVERSELITTLAEAREYYAAKLAGTHRIDCHGREVTIVFERAATHTYSLEPLDSKDIASSDRVERRIPGRDVEVRRFSVERARVMDRILPAVSQFTVSTPGTATTTGREKRMLHGARLPNGQYMRVVLRPGPGDAFTCVSAYPVEERVWREATRSKRAKFPP